MFQKEWNTPSANDTYQIHALSCMQYMTQMEQIFRSFQRTTYGGQLFQPKEPGFINELRTIACWLVERVQPALRNSSDMQEYYVEASLRAAFVAASFAAFFVTCWEIATFACRFMKKIVVVFCVLFFFLWSLFLMDEYGLLK
jgi:hypothetical protein